MTEEEFKRIAGEVWEAMPKRSRQKVENVALLVEDEPSEEVRTREGLREGETLLGLYHGVPNTERGSEYGIAGTLPDTITLYRLPLLREGEEIANERIRSLEEGVRIAVEETIWHEVGHYFGFGEEHINHREGEGTNRFES